MQSLDRRALAELQGVLRGNLQREVARRPAIGAAEAEHDVDVGGPRADADDAGQGGVHLLLAGVRKAIEIQAVAAGRRERAQRADLAAGKAGAAKLARPSRASRIRRLNGWQAAAVRAQIALGARDRELLADDDAGQPFEPGGTAAQRRMTRHVVHVAHGRAFAPQRAHARAYVVVGLDDPSLAGGRARLSHAWRRRIPAGMAGRVSAVSLAALARIVAAGDLAVPASNRWRRSSAGERDGERPWRAEA